MSLTSVEYSDDVLQRDLVTEDKVNNMVDDRGINKNKTLG